MQISTDSFPFKLGSRRNVLQVSDDPPEPEAMGSDLRLKRAGSSFVSYVDLGVGERTPARPPAATPPPDLIPLVSLKPVLCDGEVVVTEVDNVLKFNTFSDLRNGVSGVLFCTNFKLSFVTMDTSGERKPRALCANRVFGENDIGLVNVEALFQLSGGRRKRLSPQAAAAQSVEVLQVHCKDMRIFTFSFKFCQNDQCSARVLQFLSRHAFVSSVDKLFCPRSSVGSQCEPPFECAREWDAELRRCGASKLWRVTELNERYRFSGALAGRFAVPRRLVDCKLEHLAQHFCDKRAVAWCWSHPSGAALVRGAASDTGSESAENDRLQLLAQCLGADVHVTNLDLECPIVREVGSSYHKLQGLCMPADEAEFLEQESRFYAALESTRWLECVSGCLKVTLATAKVIAERRKHVLVREQTGADMTCVVVSLVQILLDPYYRTQAGFQTLIDKEWVAAGHPFPERLDILGQGRTSPEAAPVFLFFLDCVWQLQTQFPLAFEFSETYLTNLWDCCHVGIYDAFLFGNNRQRWEALKQQPYRSVWDWVGPQSRLSPQDLELFKNPLHLLQRSKELLSVGSQEGSGDRGIPSFSEDLLLLQLDPTVKALSVWTQCYFRWIPKAEVVNGDPATLFLHNVRVARDIHFLAAQIRTLKEQRDCGEVVQLRHRRLPSDEYFFAVQRSSARVGARVAIDSQHLVTSSFPFAPPGPVDWGSCHVPSIAPLPDDDYGDLDD